MCCIVNDESPSPKLHWKVGTSSSSVVLSSLNEKLYPRQALSVSIANVAVKFSISMVSLAKIVSKQVPHLSFPNKVQIYLLVCKCAVLFHFDSNLMYRHHQISIYIH